MTDDPTPAERLSAIVTQGLCTGCGLCQSVAGPEKVRVVKVDTAYERPVAGPALDHAAVDRIYATCPGIRPEGLPERLVAPDTAIDPVWGPHRRIVEAWAGDPGIRFEGSTGGVLTALARFLLTSGRVSFILHVRASRTEPTFGERHLSFTAAQVLEGAGSRYGPAAPLIDVAEVLDRGEPFAFIGKPCDIAGLRNYARLDPRVDDLVRYWLTPVCGGTMPPAGMRAFLDRTGVDPSAVTALRYRGRGCPGPTRVETANSVHEAHYLDFWGEDATMWMLPWRCKICPDGIGEAADIAAADTWPGGSPDRVASATDPGTNAVIARTEAGEELLAAAADAGALALGAELTTDDLSGFQPHQVRKKVNVGARLRALADAGRTSPAHARLRLESLTATLPEAERTRQYRGTLERLDIGKGDEPTAVPAD